MPEHEHDTASANGRVVCIADTSIGSDNTGDQIIVEAACQQLRSLWSNSFVYRIPTHTPLGNRGKRLLAAADASFVLGTNILPSSIHPRQLWQILPQPISRRKFVLVGAGLARPSLTRSSVAFMRTLLHPQAIHSVRDATTAMLLNKAGFRVEFTGCPTTWSLGSESARTSLRARPGTDAVVVLNQSLRMPDHDRRIVAAARQVYGTVKVWCQAPRDLPYVEAIGAGGLPILAPSLDAFGAALEGSEVDVVTTRLHAALFSLARGARTTLFALDERVSRTAQDSGLIVYGAETAEECAGALTSPQRSTYVVRSQQVAQWLHATREMFL